MPENETDRYAAPPDVFPKKGSAGSGTDTAYSVEARLAFHQPRAVCGHLLDLRWTTLQFERGGPVGVPQHRPFDFAKSSSGLLSYQAAQALRWWFLANAEQEFSCLCVETRIVEHKITYSFSTEAVRIGAETSGKDRSNIMFGWGEKIPTKADAT
jgi:hypothetical protein